MLESRFKTTLAKWIRDNGGYVVRTVTGGAQVAGTPALLVCWRGRFVGMEAKRSAKSAPTPWQQRRLAEIRAAGGVGLVVHPDNWEAVKAWMLETGSQGEPKGV